jgi:hypothetical protein
MDEADIKQLPDYLCEMLGSPFLYVSDAALEEAKQRINQYKGKWQEHQERTYEANYNPAFDRACTEIVHNGGPIDWNYWAKLPNIDPLQAARLACHIDPIIWSDCSTYNRGTLPHDLQVKINRLVQQLEGCALRWSLAELVDALGDDAPFGMIQAVSAIEQKPYISKPLQHYVTIESKTTTALEVNGADSFNKGQEAIPEKRVNAFHGAVKDKKIDPDRDTLNKMHMALKSLDPELWPKSFDGFKDWREKYLPGLKLKPGRKRR